MTLANDRDIPKNGFLCKYDITIGILQKSNTLGLVSIVPSFKHKYSDVINDIVINASLFFLLILSLYTFNTRYTSNGNTTSIMFSIILSIIVIFIFSPSIIL